jgi:hypothetical protein
MHEAKQQGLSERQIHQAVELAVEVRKVPAKQVLATALAQLEDPESSPATKEACGPECVCS